MNGTEENDFLPMPDDKVKADIIYLCSPNNPTGASYNKEQLKAWVDYALKNDSVILYDSAYEAFITDQDLPRSIYAIEGAKNVRLNFALCPRQQDLQELVSPIRLFRQSWCLRLLMEQH